MSNRPQGGSFAREPQVQQEAQGSEATADGSQFTRYTSPASTASIADPGRSNTRLLTNKEEHAKFKVNKARARETARVLAASKLTKHSLTSPSTGASSDQQESFTASEIQEYKIDARRMFAVLAKNKYVDKNETTRAMWETLKAKVEHDENSGAESRVGSGDQSAHSLEERTRDSNDKMSGLVSVAHDSSKDLEWAEKDDEDTQFIGSTFH
jgi:hypothetical protein